MLAWIFLFPFGITEGHAFIGLPCVIGFIFFQSNCLTPIVPTGSAFLGAPVNIIDQMALIIPNPGFG